MASKPKLVVLMHGHGEIEILVPMLKKLKSGYDLIIDAPRDKEAFILAEIGAGLSLCGGKADAVAVERRAHLSELVRRHAPRAVITGLHSGDQKRVAKRAAEMGIRCIGLVEMTLPSERHRSDQRSSQIHKVMPSVRKFLVPTELASVRPPLPRQISDSLRCARTLEPLDLR